jgi:copper chaperone CopZ
MGTFLVAAVLVVIAVFAFKNSLGHLKGEGGCCGGGSGEVKKEIPVKELDGQKLGELVVSIEGMHCDHCVYSVTRAINRIEGAAARVDLKKKQARVLYDREISSDEVRSAIELEGFQVTNIQKVNGC